MSGYAVNREPLPMAPEWSQDAFCAGLAMVWKPAALDALIFPSDEESTVDLMARELCSHCTVRPQCLDYAISANVQGNWAGTTTRNRQAIRRRRNRAKCPVCLSVDVVLDDAQAVSLEQLHQVCTACGHSWLTDRMPDPTSFRPSAVLRPAEPLMGFTQKPPVPKRLTVKGRSRRVETVELPEVV